MPNINITYKVFVGSPSDVREERECIDEIVLELNKTWSGHVGVQLEVVKWETDTHPAFGEYPQEVINKQINDDYDVFLGVMWKRFGTPTPVADSGTVEEFERAYQKYLKDPEKLTIMFYFKNAPVPPREIDLGQEEKIRDFRKKLEKKGGLVADFKTLEHFKTLVRMHLSKLMQQFQTQSISKLSQISPPDDASPDEEKSPSLKPDNKDMEEGFLDLVEDFEMHSSKATEAVVRIGEAIEELGSEVNVAVKKINTLKAEKGGDLRPYKKISNEVARNMDAFVVQGNKELPIFKNSFKKYIDSFIESMRLTKEFGVQKKEEIQSTIESISSFKGSMVRAKDSIVGFKESVNVLPPMTTKLNKSKKSAVDFLSEFLIELENAIQLIDEAEDYLGGILD